MSRYQRQRQCRAPDSSTDSGHLNSNQTPGNKTYKTKIRKPKLRCWMDSGADSSARRQHTNDRDRPAPKFKHIYIWRHCEMAVPRRRPRTEVRNRLHNSIRKSVTPGFAGSLVSGFLGRSPGPPSVRTARAIITHLRLVIPFEFLLHAPGLDELTVEAPLLASPAKEGVLTPFAPGCFAYISG